MADQAVAEKNLGNEFYKKKEFAAAHEHYDKAIELDPNNMTFYNNKAAAYFEEGKYEECIKTCEKGVEVGREHRADFATIAKGLSRAGNAYLKLGDKKQAHFYFGKSLSEHRDPELVKKHKKLEQEIKEEEKKSYINPEISEEEKVKGNEAFKKGDYPTAIKHYNEALKRNPDNAVIYSNRAACYTKLMEFHRAVDDCEHCLKLDPKFIKAYLRKGAALVALREYSRAQKAYESALSIDPNNNEARDGLINCATNNDESPEKAREAALKDPEVQEILRDPSMRMILEQMSTDPGAVQDHLKNPEVFSKIMKLQPMLKCGMILGRTPYICNFTSIKFLKRTLTLSHRVLASKNEPDQVKTESTDKVYDIKDNIYTIPNALCVTRIVLTPVIGYLVVTESNLAACNLFLLAGFTDLIDGQIARAFPSQRSLLGTMLDPVADKLLISTLFITLAYAHLIPVPLSALVILRDVLLLAGAFRHRFQTLQPPFTIKRYFDPSVSSIEINPTFASKLNTVLQIFSVAGALAAPVLDFQDHPVLYGLWLLTAATTTYSGLQYIGGKAIKHVKPPGL
ncbi:unnamed protein product [Bursaphelenchus okinawaensis]|uniref:Stress-induced-phosphoprotein 1 n=1 Tax=Bursaphelenchus okinawaensis TaxID=465554 RepID=A0A811LAH5_9BILA|nr:unnamed protein product [Bursaphelenchus okinawaensis]CAG9122046.1 unnamed protein product [Bursaphelenchus okinawaensis]